MTVSEIFSIDCRGTVFDLPCPTSFIAGEGNRSPAKREVKVPQGRLSSPDGYSPPLHAYNIDAPLFSVCLRECSPMCSRYFSIQLDFRPISDPAATIAASPFGTKRKVLLRGKFEPILKTCFA